MARKSSIVHEVKMVLNAIDRIGISKRETRKNGDKGMIHSLKQKKETLSVSQNFAKWVRAEHGVKSLYQLNEKHYRAYMEHLEDKGVSVGHRRNVETALKHLQKGMDVRSEGFGRDKVSFVPEKRVTSWRLQEKPRNRSYDSSEYERIKSHLSPSTRDAVILMRELGLRVKEATNVEVRHFKSDGGVLRLQIENGSGITKGGRFRSLEVLARARERVERMMAGKQPTDKLVAVKIDTVRRAVNEACKRAEIPQMGRGTHGFRHAYARERVQDLLNHRGIVNEGRRMMGRILQNRQNGKGADYGILSDSDKELYDRVKECIDQVHSEIGHGKDRWDLALVYMLD